MLSYGMPDDAWKLLAALDNQDGSMHWNLQKWKGKMSLMIIWPTNTDQLVPFLDPQPTRAQMHCHIPCKVRSPKKKKSPSQLKRDRKRLQEWKAKKHNTNACKPNVQESFSFKGEDVPSSSHWRSNEAESDDNDDYYLKQEPISRIEECFERGEGDDGDHPSVPEGDFPMGKVNETIEDQVLDDVPVVDELEVGSSEQDDVLQTEAPVDIQTEPEIPIAAPRRLPMTPPRPVPRRSLRAKKQPVRYPQGVNMHVGVGFNDTNSDDVNPFTLQVMEMFLKQILPKPT